ncbi:MAG TPA: hypothetical protein VIL84_14750 [Devosiaceae bacterium]
MPDRRRFLLAGAALVGASAWPGAAFAATWIPLATVSVGPWAERNAIKVGAEKGRFKRIKFQTEFNTVRISDVRIVYSDGTYRDYGLDSEIFVGGVGAVDVPNPPRAIERIYATFRRKRGGGMAFVRVSGLRE